MPSNILSNRQRLKVNHKNRKVSPKVSAKSEAKSQNLRHNFLHNNKTLGSLVYIAIKNIPTHMNDSPSRYQTILQQLILETGIEVVQIAEMVTQKTYRENEMADL